MKHLSEMKPRELMRLYCTADRLRDQLAQLVPSKASTALAHSLDQLTEAIEKVLSAIDPLPEHEDTRS